MQTTILTLVTLAAAVVADRGTGSIINSCDFEVNLDNVPAGGNGQEIYSTVLSANGGSYSQDWTSLNWGGWSMKVTPSFNETSVMQFEYTYSDAAPNDLWFDLSYVNGNPFSGNWLISSSSDDCLVKQTAYMNPYDDANGMQVECTPDVSITVTLCPSAEDESTGPVISSVVSSVLEPATTVASSTEEPTTTVEPTTTEQSVAEPTSTEAVSVATTTAATTKENNPLDASVFEDAVTTAAAPSTTSSPSPTTFATQTTFLAVNQDGLVVTEVETVLATSVVTVYGHGHHFQRHNHANARK